MEGTVMFIDDQEDFLKLLEIKLKKEEYKKIYCTDVEEALKIIDKQEVDVVVSDMNMPKNGLELLKILKKEHPQIIRVTLSGLYQAKNILDAINQGEVFRYIVKPWKVDGVGKQIIRDAIDYSNYIKFKYHCDCNVDVISLAKLEAVMGNLGIEYELIERGLQKEGDIELNLKYLLRVKR